MDYITIIVNFMKYLIEKYGLFKSIFVICLPILIFKLDGILTAIHLFFD